MTLAVQADLVDGFLMIPLDPTSDLARQIAAAQEAGDTDALSHVAADAVRGAGQVFAFRQSPPWTASLRTQN